MDLKLNRIFSNDEATLGVLFIQDKPYFTTLELPYRNNEKDISCIPVGQYKANAFHSPKWGNTFQLEVENRDAIEFHPGNFPQDTHGCILLGMTFAPDEIAIYESAKAFKIFQEVTKEAKSVIIDIK